MDEYERDARERELDEEARKVVRAMSDYVNVLGQDTMRAEAFARALDREHRTLQQGMMRLVVAMLEHWDKSLDDHNYDGRNEATVKLARRLLSSTDKYDRFLPCI